jgi:hypothetical protein
MENKQIIDRLEIFLESKKDEDYIKIKTDELKMLLGIIKNHKCCGNCSHD